MADDERIDLRAAINAVSDVIVNRPRPIRMLDQIYMKAGDMVLQSELVARWADGKRLAFIGDGDAISVCVAYLHKRGIIKYGPSRIIVFDFDERICRAVERFADRERIETLGSQLYNCLDAFPHNATFDCFYTNPPWGASNQGESVKLFAQRGMEAAAYGGEGMIVIADDLELAWPQVVLSAVQRFALENGYFTQKMMARLHTYHLDDAPDLRSCNLVLKALPGNVARGRSEPITDPERLRNFYGRDNPPKVKYVRERKRLDYGNALEEEYELELIEGTT
jgi:Branched-chain polyamine synthase A C-terminal domain